MKKLAIRGSETGTDVIEYLESLGGIKSIYEGNSKTAYYYIDSCNLITAQYKENIPSDYIFLEKVPSQKVNNYELWD